MTETTLLESDLPSKLHFYRNYLARFDKSPDNVSLAEYIILVCATHGLCNLDKCCPNPAVFNLTDEYKSKDSTEKAVLSRA
jgi:hypothetical protein